MGQAFVFQQLKKCEELNQHQLNQLAIM